ncbi:MAG: hypothetical protein ACD_73C00699G0001, partial [uncultured bacterium]
MRKKIFLLAAFIALVLPVYSQAQEIGEIKVAIDTLWTMIAGFLVFWMNAGFAMVEAGLCRSKNAVNILAKNF